MAADSGLQLDGLRHRRPREVVAQKNISHTFRLVIKPSQSPTQEHGRDIHAAFILPDASSGSGLKKCF